MNKLYDRIKKHNNNSSSRKYYATYKNKLSREIRTIKECYYMNESCKQDNSIQQWKLVKYLTLELSNNKNYVEELSYWNLS